MAVTGQVHVETAGRFRPGLRLAVLALAALTGGCTMFPSGDQAATPGTGPSTLVASAAPAGSSPSRPLLPSAPVSGRQVCPIAANGSPDCREGATLLCRSRGYSSGTVIDIERSWGCRPEDFRRRLAGETVACPSTALVLRAFCIS
jgi:hypothetical protein